MIEWTLFVHNEGCREITTLFWLQIRCIELSNTVTENVVKCRTLESEGECDRLGLRTIPQAEQGREEETS